METNTELFAAVGTDVMNNAWDGYNSTVFAYGQTGAGKTFSMSGTSEDPGLTPRVCQQMFQPSKEKGLPNARVKVSVSVAEVYKEKVYDLLNQSLPAAKNTTRKPKSPRPSEGAPPEALKVRESPERGMYVEGISEHDAKDAAEIQQIMDQAESHRRVGQTLMNSTSSRSHSVVMLQLHQYTGKEDEAGRHCKIVLVDLAGSERPAFASGGDQARFKEGVEINKSLTALGNVIAALAEGKKHVPFRDSVLTCLLRESLGGNSRTAMIAAVSPADSNFDESMSTLRFADRAKHIVNKAVVNEDPAEARLREMQEEIDRLRAQLNGTDGGGQAPCCVVCSVACAVM